MFRVLLQATDPSVSVRALLGKYKIESARNYILRSRIGPPCRHSASWPLQRALLMPQADAGPRYRCGKGT